MTDLPLHLQHCQSGSKPERLATEQLKQLLAQLPHWDYSEEKQEISRYFNFKDYYQTLAFINAVAWIAQQENHHPGISFSYNSCDIHFTTHSAGGVTKFDFICAAQVNRLLDPD